MKLFIDLFSGLGGAFQGFIETHEILAFDNNPILLEHNDFLILSDIAKPLSIVAHIFDFIVNNGGEIEEVVLWGSPPCVQYSTANPNRNPDEFDNTLVLANLVIKNTLEAYFKEFHPDTRFYWCIENVKGAYQELTRVIGHEPLNIQNKWFLWGVFPRFDVKVPHHTKLVTQSTRALRPNARAVIPLQISQGLLNSIRTQTTLKIY